MLFVAITSFSQQWKKNMPQKNKQELTLFDYQNAFTAYWNNYNVNNGKYFDKNGIEHKAPGWKQFKRWEYYWESRVDKQTGKFPKEKIQQEYKKYHSQLLNNKSKSAWTSIGPNTTAGGYYGIGRVATIAFHPSDANTFWIGAPAGGLWVTTSGGNDWTPLTENNEVIGVSAIAIPSDYETSSTIYIGTGDRDAFDNNSIGVLKSTNAGSTWNQTGLTFSPASGEVVNAMLLYPSDNNMIFAATSNGLYISSNAGTNWVQTSNIEFIDIEFNPANPTILYSSARNGRIYKSIDTGDNWTEILNTEGGNRAELAVSVASPNRLYVLGANGGNGLHGIWRSDDSGDNFIQIPDVGPLLNWSENGTGDNDGQAWYDLSFASSPTNADVLFLGGVNTWTSNDGGSNWSLANHWYGGGGAQAIHADKHFLKFRPGTSTIFECNDGGVYKSTNGTSWTHLANGLVISQMYGLSTAQTVNNTTITGLQDNGTKAMLNGTWTDVMGGDGMKSLIDFTDEQIQYGSSQYGNIQRTINGWSSSTNVTPNESGNGPWVTQYELDPNDNNILYVGRNALWKSEDKGNNYTNIGSFSNLKSIAIAPSNSNTIYIASSSTIRKSINGGETWNIINNGLPTSTNVFKDIAVKSDDDNTLWVALGNYTSDGVYESIDGGQNWTNISSGLPEVPINAIIQNKFETAEIQLYAGTDFGVYIKNGTNDWLLYGTGMPKVVISQLDMYYDNSTPENSKLRASTYGRGLWEIPLELSGNFAPQITSSNITNITTNSATAGGEILNTYGFSITESGILVSTSPNPILNGDNVSVYKTAPTVTSGTFSLDFNSLTSGTRYYCRAYAKNQNGTGYGNTIQFNTDCSINSTVPYIQDFENYGLMPLCWSEELINSGSYNWIFGDLPTYHPYLGQYCAYVDGNTQDEDKTMLIMPVSDLSGFTNLHLSFWHIQVPLFSFQDELRVLYKNNIADDWTQLAYYNTAINEWTQHNINLPNLSSTYYIAFEANEKMGRGIGVDNVSIDEGVGINNLNTNKVRIFPNPSSGEFSIAIDKDLRKTLISLYIIDISGRQVKNLNLRNQNEQIKLNLSNLKKGIYFINLIFEQQTYTKRLILE